MGGAQQMAGELVPGDRLCDTCKMAGGGGDVLLGLHHRVLARSGKLLPSV